MKPAWAAWVWAYGTPPSVLWHGLNSWQKSLWWHQSHSSHSQRKETLEGIQRDAITTAFLWTRHLWWTTRYPFAFVWLPARSQNTTTILTGNRRKLRLSCEARIRAWLLRENRLLCHLSAEPPERALPPYETQRTSHLSREPRAPSTKTWRQKNK